MNEKVQYTNIDCCTYKIQHILHAAIYICFMRLSIDTVYSSRDFEILKIASGCVPSWECLDVQEPGVWLNWKSLVIPGNTGRITGKGYSSGARWAVARIGSAEAFEFVVTSSALQVDIRSGYCSAECSTIGIYQYAFVIDFWSADNTTESVSM